MSLISPGLQYVNSSDRFYASKKGLEMYKTLRDGDERFHPFTTFIEIFLLGLAIGIVSHTRVEEEGRFDELLFVMETYINRDRFGVFPLIVKSMHPELDKSQVARMMERYAEGGVRIVHDEFKRSGKVDFQAMLKLRPT